MWKVQLFKLNYDEQEVQAVCEVLRSAWITMGPKTEEFERAFAAHLGADSRATAVANGTAALHLALLALGVGPGDEVIVPSLTFVADLNTVMLVGAKPVLADCTSLSDWNMDPADIERKVTPRTKAVMIVHYAGYPCAMDRILAVCDRHRLPLIEDCAHAPGAKYRGRSLGTFGAFGCFSFFTNKNLSVGEGGMVVSQYDEGDREIRYLRSHGMTALTLDRHLGRSISYDVIRPGLNYRIDEMRAALGVVQLAKLPNAQQRRAAIVARYTKELAGIAGLMIPFASGCDDIEPAYHIFPVLLPVDCHRSQVIASLKAEGVQSSIHYPACQDFSAYCKLQLGETPIACEITHRELTLPLYPTMTDGEVDIVIGAFTKALEKGRA
ncbi:MAG: UDP-4-amino-4-deoxy-L-arabinose--oxoglutarate aminotransferase [Candidatus Accumulibacter adjunctus]|mgnify:CR=1 FL=1|uniref:UDP-4-amino-4-deoxy-L-arabinose--oxoglutarate aminotransferase n=1 Tax=Candidatus Accumulibacter adjunctus TaxID=1454001 RepID=A0A011PCZ5_9PROT|nr:MAG: UDP-4-amino-4-deoxy-L-arabinose--oxoglutarate aminotransferase [Candidatus Accumulibacter adjunctus]